MHLDPCRHFFSVEFTKKYLDYMAYHKLNKFHWHLTEDQGWRIEIKKYPKLVEIGSKRKGTLILDHNTKWKEQKYDTIPVEGYYTQEQIREIVAYAKERFIEVIPEIEMPGHATAALAAEHSWPRAAAATRVVRTGRSSRAHGQAPPRGELVSTAATTKHRVLRDAAAVAA